MRLAISDGKGIRDPIILNTPSSFQEGIQLLKRTAITLIANERVCAIGGCIAGPLDKEKHMLIHAPNLPQWNNNDIVAALQTSFPHIPIVIENDAAAEGLGEAIEGAGVRKAIVAYITIGTGIGGARIVNGTIDKSTYGFEPGQQIISASLQQETPFMTWEQCGSGKGIRTTYHQDSASIKDEQLWEHIAFITALGLNNIIVLWSPEIIVLGGSVVQSIPLEFVRSHLQKITTIFLELPLVTTSILKEKAGLTGALHLVKQRINS